MGLGNRDMIFMKRFVFGLLFIMIAVTCLGCSGATRDSSEIVEIENPRTETDTLKDWFPNLQGIESAEWELKVYGTQSSVPGPTDYQIKGVIILDEENAQEYWNQYEWEEVTAELETEYVDTSAYEDITWYRSTKMTADMLSPGKNGDIYFSGKYVWVNVSTS